MIFVTTSTILLTSCSFGGDKVFVSSEEKLADARIKQLLSAIKDKDKEAMKVLFSKQAVDEIKDFDSTKDYLFDFFQGDVKSWERDKWSSGESVQHGKKSLMISSWYTVDTDKDKYLFFVIDYTKDTITPNNEGLYTLRVIKAKDKETDSGYWQDKMIAGIYEPEE